MSYLIEVITLMLPAIHPFALGSKGAGLSIEASSQLKSAGCQTTLCRLVLPGYQLKRNRLCLKSLKICPRLQEIASI